MWFYWDSVVWGVIGNFCNDVVTFWHVELILIPKYFNYTIIRVSLL